MLLWSRSSTKTRATSKLQIIAIVDPRGIIGGSATLHTKLKVRLQCPAQCTCRATQPGQCGKQKLPCSGHCCTGTVLEPPGCRNRPTACWPAPEQAGCLLAPVARNRPCSRGRLPCCTGTGRPPGPSSQSWPRQTWGKCCTHNGHANMQRPLPVPTQGHMNPRACKFKGAQITNSRVCKFRGV